MNLETGEPIAERWRAGRARPDHLVAQYRRSSRRSGDLHRLRLARPVPHPLRRADPAPSASPRRHRAPLRGVRRQPLRLDYRMDVSLPLLYKALKKLSRSFDAFSPDGLSASAEACGPRAGSDTARATIRAFIRPPFSPALEFASCWQRATGRTSAAPGLSARATAGSRAEVLVEVAVELEHVAEIVGAGEAEARGRPPAAGVVATSLPSAPRAPPPSRAGQVLARDADGLADELAAARLKIP